jgi:hypothetical protein
MGSSKEENSFGAAVEVQILFGGAVTAAATA